ncbi:MAG: DUF4783 domain-containing protein [Chlorobi bacterium]|nr:DUF4783 domain-containing protein [Chlorobiota bacterium]
MILLWILLVASPGIPVHNVPAESSLAVVRFVVSAKDLHGVSSPYSDDPRAILRRIRKSFQDANPVFLKDDLGQRVYLSLFSGKSGYFSNGQTYQILKNFFNRYPAKSCTFTSGESTSDSRYLSGRYQYLKRGRLRSAQVFVSIIKSRSGWKINQITITR